MTFPLLDDTATKHRVYINGNLYVTVGASDLQEQPAAEFAVQVAQGPPSRDTRENVSYWNMASWTPGMGKKFGDFREDQGRFWRSNLDTRFAEQLTLGPLVQQLDDAQATGDTIATTSRGAIATYKSNDYFAFVDKIMQNVSGTLTERQDTTATGSVTKLASYINAAGTERLYCFAGNIWYSADGTAWTNAGLVGRWGIEYDRNLIVLDGTANVGAIAATTVGDNVAGSYTEYVDFNTSATSIISGLVFINKDGEPVPFFALADTTGGQNSGLWWLDFYTRKAFPVAITRNPQRNVAQNESFFGMAVWNGDLYLPDRHSLLRYRPDGGLSDIGTHVGGGQGVPAGYGPYGYLVPTASFLFLTMGSGTTYAIGAQSVSGLHWLVRRSLPVRALAISNIQSPARLYWIEGADAGTAWAVYYIELPLNGENPVNDSTYQYAATGELITPWMSGGFDDLDKILLRMRIRGEGLTATETVVIAYQLDDSGTDDGTWTSLGTFDAASDILRFGSSQEGVGARSFRFRITLNRGATDTATPIVRALTLDYLVTPDYRAANTLMIDLGATIRERGEPYATMETLLTEFETAYEADTLVTFAWGADTATRVKVVSYKTSMWDLDMPDPTSGSKRDGLTQVQVMEVLA